MGITERIFKIVLGIVFLVIGVSLLWYWKHNFLALLKGSIPLGIGLVGLVFLLLGFEKN